MNLFRKSWAAKSLAALLTVTTVAQSAIPIFSATAYDKEKGTFVLTDSDGNTTVVDESWEETYPTGTFAFSADQINLYEGATDGSQTNTITLYRLGGTEGRAEAYVTLSPMVMQLDENTNGYSYAAGTQDYMVSVENPQPIAFYQPLGIPGDVVRSSSYAIATDPAKSKDKTYPYYIVGLDKADSYQWQVLSGATWDEDERPVGGTWQDVSGATDALFYVENHEYFDNVRCIFTVKGVSYCTLDDFGVAYEDGIEDELLEPMPEDFVNSTEKTYYDVEFDGNEYDMYTIAVIFADGEWQKDITFTALDDDLHENTEIVALQITEAKGAVLYDGAMTATVAIADDEDELPSQIGFATDVVYANKAEGTVQIPLMREDGTQYIVGAVYEIGDGTAVLGTDYAVESTEGVTYFPADMTTTALEVTLIDDGVTLEKDETGLYFTVTLTEVQGAVGSGIMTGKDTCKVYLYNTSVEKPANGNIATELYSGEETDAGADVLTTPALATMQGTIVAEAEEEPEDVVGSYEAMFSTEVGKARSYDYGKLKFDSLAGDSGYWKDYTEFAHANRFQDYDEKKGLSATEAQEALDAVEDKMDKLEGYTTSLSNWTFDVSNKNNTNNWGSHNGDGRWYRTEKGGSMQILFSTPDGFTLNDIYTELGMVYRAKGGSNTFAGSSIHLSYKDDKKSETDVVGKGSEVMAKKIVTVTADMDRVKFRSNYSGTGDATSFVQLDLGYLQRRTMSAPTVVLHTADDEIITNASLTSTDVRDAMLKKIEPKISMVSGEGGVTSNGDFYVGSQITIQRNTGATAYQFATAEKTDPNDATTIVETAVTFTAQGTTNTAYTMASPSSGVATLTLAKPASETGASQINIYMDRVQEVILDITPSVPRTEEGAATIDTTKIDSAWTEMWKRTSGVQYTHKLAQVDGDGMKYGNLETADLLQTYFTKKEDSSSAAQYSVANVKNLRKINFHLNENDCIVFNGKTYKGNEDIEIPAYLYAERSLVFYYYNEEYLSMDSTMVATITNIERYIDLNDNGMVDDGDIAMDSLSEDSYTITELSPVEVDGTYHQIVLRTYYNMLPRNLFAPTDANLQDKAEVLPALVTTQYQGTFDRATGVPIPEPSGHNGRFGFGLCTYVWGFCYHYPLY